MDQMQSFMRFAGEVNFVVTISYMFDIVFFNGKNVMFMLVSLSVE